MRSEDFPIAILALLSIVTLVPAWLYALDASSLSGQTAWVAGLVLPAMVTLYLVSWVRPSLVGPVLGAWVLAGSLAIAPQLWTLAGLASDSLPGDSVAGLAVQVALPVLIVAYVAGLGWARARRRVQQ